MDGEKYGLATASWEHIIEVLQAHDAVEEAVLYGSRAKGTFRYNSDIDLTLKGDALNLTTLYRIATELDDLMLP